MSLTAFNSSEFPSVTPWECFSPEWFSVLLNDAFLMKGLKNSLIIGLGVVCLSVPLGLAASILLTQVHHRVRSFLYTILISPILVPGVVLGISTLIFWDRLGAMFQVDYESFFYDGIFLTIIGQSTFISAYTMLVFIARLQRFDPVLEEAALDLGATNVQSFRKILLPFLKPAIGSAAVLAFLASFENYNTTVFTIITESTLTTVLASKVRYGINPSISALAVIIVVLTLFGAIIHEIKRRRELKRGEAVTAMTKGRVFKQTRAVRSGNPVYVMVLLIFVAGLGTAWVAKGYNIEQCKVRVAEEKKEFYEERIRLLNEKRAAALVKEAEKQTESLPDGTPKKQYQSIFAPSNLQGQVDSDKQVKTPPNDTPKKQYQSIFAPSNLEGQVNSKVNEPDPVSTTPAKQYQSIFAPSNLEGQVDSSKKPDPEAK